MELLYRFDFRTKIFVSLKQNDMRANQTFSISFFIRKKKKQPELSLLYARVTVNSKSLEISLKRTVPVIKWNQSAGKMQGTGIESQQINKKIDETKDEIRQLENNLGFFHHVDENNPLVKEVHKNIERHKEQLEVWKAKLSKIKEVRED